MGSLLLLVIFVAISKVLTNDPYKLNNVCGTQDDYKNMWTNNKCWYNPDVGANVEEMIRNNGYSATNYEVRTEDGYILTMFRVTNGDELFSGEKQKQPVFLLHGLASSHASFTKAGNNSLAFQFVERGYDVWLGTFRGTYRYTRHENLTSAGKKYWDFSFHEIAIYDVPAQLQRVVEVAGSERKIIFVGFSMGTTVSLIYASEKTDEASSILDGIVALAPVYAAPTFVKLGPILGLVNLLTQNKVEETTIVDAFFINPEPFRKLFFARCVYLTSDLCFKDFQRLYGRDSGQFLPEYVPLHYSSFPDSVSSKTLEHYLQIARRGQFAQFDYGRVLNVARYGQRAPPPYRLGNIEIPVHLFYGRDDRIASKTDAQRIFQQLTATRSMTEIPGEKYPNETFNHMSFALSKDIEKLLYQPLFQVIQTNF